MRLRKMTNQATRVPLIEQRVKIELTRRRKIKRKNKINELMNKDLMCIVEVTDSRKTITK